MTAGPVCGLRVDLGEHTRPWAPRYGTWLRLPAADFWCPCDWGESASGDAVPGFVATVRADHAAVCPLRRGRGP